jgi:hypothetical protein
MPQPQGKPSQKHGYQVDHGYQAAAQGKMGMISEYAVNNGIHESKDLIGAQGKSRL